MDTTTDSPRSHRSDRRRGGRALVAVAIPLGVVASGALVWQASYAAFTATTDNEGNTWSTGTVVLDHSPVGVTFNATGLNGGEAVTDCIEVTYTGSLDANVVLTLEDVTGDIGQYLTVDVQEEEGACAAVTGSPADTTTGTLAAFGADDAWSVAGGGADDVRSYTITTTVADDQDAQGTSGTATFRWTATGLDS